MQERNENLVKNNQCKVIEERVSLYLDGKHGKIGVICPEGELSTDEIKELSRQLAIIIFDSL